MFDFGEQLWNVNLNPKEVKCLGAVYFGRDALAVLPTGYGESIVFHLLPSLFGKIIHFYGELGKDKFSTWLPVPLVGFSVVISHFLGDT